MTKERKNVLLIAFRLLVIIASIALAAYAWLNKNNEIKANDLVLRTNSYSDLLISLDGEEWSNELSLDFTNDYSFDHEITGDGVNFYIATSKRDDGTPVTFKRATANKDYLEFDVWFKSSGNVGVFLEDSSYVLPATGTDENDLLGTEVERLSSSGNFSRDLIAASTRLAFIDNEYNNGYYAVSNKASLVWAPNKNYKIDCSTGKCFVTLYSVEQQDYRFIDASESAIYELTSIDNLRDNLSASHKIQSANGDPMLTYLDNKKNDGIKKVTIRIWIEGNDRDNLTALTGGMFEMNLSFTSFAKQINNQIPNVSVIGNTINNYTSDLEYSNDLGLSWIKYENENNPSFEKNEVVYVRQSETGTTFASNHKILNF